MNGNCSKAGGSAGRGEKWGYQLDRVEAMLAPVNEPLIRALGLDEPCRIAEVGCGGGGTSLGLLRHAPKGTVVHAFDIAPALIEVARGHATAQGNLTFETDDMATAIPPKLPYDRLVSRFGVMFFADPLAAFENLLGWLAPAGRFAFAVWSRPEDNPWMTVVRETVVEAVGLPPSDPEAPGPFRYGAASRFLALLAQAGFSDVAVRDWRGTLPISGELLPADAADFALASVSSFAEVLAEAGDQALSVVRQKLAERFFAYQQGGAVRMEACIHSITGSRARRKPVSAEVEGAGAAHS